MNIKKIWTEFKTIVTSKDLSIQYREGTSEYNLWASDTNDEYLCFISKTDPASTDQTDFENNYKDNANSSIATLIQPFAKDSVDFKGEGKGGIVTKGTTQDIDLKLIEDMYCDGGFLFAGYAEFGDYIKAQVIDIDDVLGYGENYILKTWIEKWYVIPDQIMYVKVNQGGTIPANVYLRLKYTSIGSTNDIKFAVNYHLYKKK